MASRKEILKKVLGELPLTAEVYWLLRQSSDPLPYNFSLKTIREILPEAVAITKKSRKAQPAGKKIFLFASTHYWLEHVVMTGLALSGMGHDVTVGYYPFGKWNIDTNQFDLRRQNVYANNVLKEAAEVIHFENMLRNNFSFSQLPARLTADLEQVTDYDYMYHFQTEEVNRDDSFYQFRYNRNLHASKALYNYLRKSPPDVAIIPVNPPMSAVNQSPLRKLAIRLSL